MTEWEYNSTSGYYYNQSNGLSKEKKNDNFGFLRNMMFSNTPKPE